MQKEICKDSEIKNLSEYNGLYLKIDTLILVIMFLKTFEKCV